MKTVTLDQLPMLFFALTLAFYWLASHIRARTGHILSNPVLICTVAIILMLKLGDIPYDVYHQSAVYIDFWLQPAVVCLAVPLFLQWQKIRQQWLPVFLAQLLGSLTGIISGVLIAESLGAPRAVTLSLAAKSITTPIAIEVTKTLGGIPPLTAATVILAGMVGQMVGFRALKRSGVRPLGSQGIAVGTASHALGISAALERSQKIAAYATLGLIFNGILTAIIAPIIVPWLVR